MHKGLKARGLDGMKRKRCIFELKCILSDINIVVGKTCENQFPEDSIDRTEALLLVSRENIGKLINWLEND